MAPLFSVVIPTRNRPQLARRAVSHLLEHTFGEFEVLVLENSDVQELAAERFADSRVRVVPSGRVLSMPDNWERGLDHVSGDYVLYISDKDFLLPYALADLEHAVSSTKAVVVNYRKALLHDGFLYLQRCTHRVETLPTTPVIDEWFARAHYLGNSPMIYNSAARRSHVLHLRSGGRRFFNGVCPDVASGVLLAASTDRYGLADEICALSYSGSWSTAVSHLYGAGATSAFAAEFGDDAVTRAGLVWSTSGNIAQTLLACREAFPELLGGREIRWDAYLHRCLEELELRRRRGVDIRADLRLLRREAGRRYSHRDWLKGRVAARTRALSAQARSSLRDAVRRRPRLRSAARTARHALPRGRGDADAPAVPTGARSPLNPAYLPERACSDPEEALAEITRLRPAGIHGEAATRGSSR